MRVSNVAGHIAQIDFRPLCVSDTFRYPGDQHRTISRRGSEFSQDYKRRLT
jgi:hypothetical protein